MRKIESDSADLEYAPLALKGSCAAGGTASIEQQITEPLLLSGGKIVTDGNAVFGDWVSAQMVDVDNLLGQGPGFVVKDWIPKRYIDWKNCADTAGVDFKGEIPAGLYIRLTYHSTGANAVGFAINLDTFRKL